MCVTFGKVELTAEYCEIYYEVQLCDLVGSQVVTTTMLQCRTNRVYSKPIALQWCSCCYGTSTDVYKELS